MLTRLTNLFAQRNTTRQAKLNIELLDEKELPATLLLLDFNGMSNADLRTVVSRVQSPPALSEPAASGQGVSDFVAVFSNLNREFSRYRFLDFNRDGRLNSTDANVAITEIIQGVEADYAPYDVRVLRSDTTATALSQMRLSSAHDAYVLVNGGDDAGGQAMLDKGNPRDDAMAAGGSLGIARLMANGFVAGTRTSENARAGFLNMITTFVSHEAGHSFGLAHADVSRTPSADDRNLMDPYLWDRNTGFWDLEVAIEGGGTQNQHRLLTATLGAATKPWVAVLRPGELTIQGSRADENVVVKPNTGNTWTVQTSWLEGTTWHVKNYNLDDSSTPGINSMNQFRQRISSIRYSGGDGNDRFAITVNTIASVTADGGNGNDQLSASAVGSVLNGGAGNDMLMGSSGNDTLTGGTGNDNLYGDEGQDHLDGGADHDLLYGGNGNDQLYGQVGRDTLWGGNGDDYLDGGADNIPDSLSGEVGADRFIQFHPTLRSTTNEANEYNFDFVNGVDRLVML